MALLFMDSFDHYATADIEEKWTQLRGPTGGSNTTPVIGSYGRNSTQGLYCARASGTNVYTGGGVAITLVPSGSTCIVGMAVKYSAFTNLNVSDSETITYASSNWLVRCLNVNALGWFARVNTDGTITVYRGVGGTPVALGTTSLALQAGVFAYVEIKVVMHPSAGTVNVRINSASGLALTGQNTRGNAGADAWTNLDVVGLITTSTTNAMSVALDDLVVMDGSGSYNNAFLGDVTISAVLPNGAGNSSGWTPSAGSNYQCVDEASPNDDTDYNSTSTLNAKDLYAFPDAPAGADIRAVQIVSAQRKGAEGPGQIKHVVRSSSTDYDQTAQGIGGTSYSFLRTVVEADPATAAAWSESGFNAAEFGIKKTG